MKKIEDWDFNAEHVQNDINNGRFVNAKSTLIAFGPPKFYMIARGDQASSQVNEKEIALTDEEFNEDKFISTIYTEGNSFTPVPVGIVQNMTMQQQRQVSKIFEIGSDRPYHIPGNTFSSLNLSRVLYDGPSLLKFAMIFYLKRLEDGLLGDVDAEKLNNMTQVARAQSGEEDYETSLKGVNRPGFDQFYINLSSDLFNFPLGVLLYFKNNAGQPYGAAYLEDCYINTHGMGLRTGDTVISENVSMEFDRPVGVNVKSGFGNVNS